jgi:hypothetical protein
LMKACIALGVYSFSSLNTTSGGSICVIDLELFRAAMNTSFDSLSNLECTNCTFSGLIQWTFK